MLVVVESWLLLGVVVHLGSSEVSTEGAQVLLLHWVQCVGDR